MAANKSELRASKKGLDVLTAPELPFCMAMLPSSTLEERHVKRAVEEAYSPSEKIPEGTPVVNGYDFNQGLDYKAILQQMSFSGFQAQHYGQAVKEVTRMLDWRLSDEPVEEDSPDEWQAASFRGMVKAKVFLGCTSNMISSGNREVICYLAQHSQFDVMVTTAGGVEEDFMKCLGSFYVATFDLDGTELREKGFNRTGNLLVPNETYTKLHAWAFPILEQMLHEQEKEGVMWTPSKLIRRFGREINDPNSIYFWCYKNNIPVYCPSITDGGLGDSLYLFHYMHPGPSLRLDIVEDVVAMDNEAILCPPQKRGCILLGGGLPKHHILNANCLAGGADFVVYINTANEFDGSDSGASPDEARSWGKIKDEAQAIKVLADATLVFPLLVAETFATRIEAAKEAKKQASI